MKSPSPPPLRARIVVVRPEGKGVTQGRSAVNALPSNTEADAIVQAVAPHLRHFANQFDEKKYWPDVYATVLEAFQVPAKLPPSVLRDALLWKYGHLGKPAIPAHHDQLIREIQGGWQAMISGLPAEPKPAFTVLDERFGHGRRFITVSFLLHLLFPREVPIIDQHNFRGLHGLMSDVRTGWRSKKKPSRYADIELVAGFTNRVLAAWTQSKPTSVPSEREFDKFLMMYGKILKTRVSSRRRS